MKAFGAEKELDEILYMIERRLQGMKDGGLVTEREGKYFLTAKGERLGKLFHQARVVLKYDRKRHMKCALDFPASPEDVGRSG